MHWLLEFRQKADAWSEDTVSVEECDSFSHKSVYEQRCRGAENPLVLAVEISAASPVIE
jgi:hypothetical protein